MAENTTSEEEVAPPDTGLSEPQSDSVSASTSIPGDARQQSFRHLWDPLRLSKASVFASKTARVLSLSRSLSQSTEQLNLQQSKAAAGPGRDFHGVFLSSIQESFVPSDDSLPKPHDDFRFSVDQPISYVNDPGFQSGSDDLVDSVQSRPTRTNCLRLIDRLWQSGLDSDLERRKCRSRRLSELSVASMESHADCVKCSQLKHKLMNDSSKDVEEEVHDHSEGCEKQVKMFNSSSDNSLETPAQVQQGASNDPSSEHSEVMQPPYKKAKYGWQVKNRSRSNPDSNTSGVSDVRTVHVDCSDSVGFVNCSTENLTETDVEESCKHSDEGDSVSDINVVPCESDLENVSDKEKATQKRLEPSPRQPKPSIAMETDAPMNLPARLSTEVYPTAQRGRPSNRDFHMLTQALTQLDHAERWQCQHVAKAIVDNAINKTLEEMGLSPDHQTAAPYSEQRSRIEDAGVSQAILSRGLRRYSPNSYRMRRLNPIISRLTRVSEHLFADNLRGGLRSMDEAAAAADVEDMDDEEQESTPMDLFNFDDSNAISFDQTGSPLSSEEEASSTEPVSQNASSSNVDSTPQEVTSAVAMANKSPDLTAMLENPVSSNFILDQAVDAIICERGLQF